MRGLLSLSSRQFVLLRGLTYRQKTKSLKCRIAMT